MPLTNRTYSVEVEATSADFDNDIYYQVYSVSAATVTVNGFEISMAADSELNILIKSISTRDSGVYLLGEKKYAVNPPTTLSKYPEPLPPPNRDVDVQAFLDATGIADSDIISALETYVATLKTESLWDKMIALYPLVTDKTEKRDIQDQFKYNLKDPQDTDAAYRLTFNGSVVIDNKGITSMGGAAYMNTHISSVGVFTDDRPTFGYSNLTFTDNRYGVIGSVIGTSLSYNYIQFTWPFSLGYRIDMDSSPYSTNGLSGWDGTGTHIFSRMDDTNVRIISSDGTKQTSTIPIEGLAEVEFTIGLKTAVNEGINTNTISFVFFSNKLEDAEASTLQTAINQLQTDLGRAFA